MTKVLKRHGEMQDFDRRKLEESTRKAGATEEVAKRVAERIIEAEKRKQFEHLVIAAPPTG